MNNSLQKLLIILGIVIIPFYEIFLKFLPFVKSISPDTRVNKEIIALVFALSIGLLAVFQGTIKPFKNKWFLLIPIYLLFNLIMAPHADMFINGIESGDFYFWKPFSEVLIFALMIIAIASIEINFEEVLFTMVICGTIMAAYVIMQYFGFDQFWITKSMDELGGFGNPKSVTSPSLGGNLGQSTLVASFIIMIIPLAFYFRRYWMVLLMIISVLLTKSDMARIALGFIGIFSLMYFKRNFIVPIIFIFLTLSIVGIWACQNFNGKSFIENHMSGRAEVWKNIYTDIRDGAIEGEKQDFSFTGVGLGRFGFIFPDRHKSEFKQAHNDLLELIYDCGLIGLGLLIGGIGLMISGVLSNISPIRFSILLSFIAILFCSFGSFPFQLGAHQFYSSILVGLLNNDSILRRVKC